MGWGGLTSTRTLFGVKSDLFSLCFPLISKSFHQQILVSDSAPDPKEQGIKRKRKRISTSTHLHASARDAQHSFQQVSTTTLLSSGGFFTPTRKSPPKQIDCLHDGRKAFGSTQTLLSLTTSKPSSGSDQPSHGVPLFCTIYFYGLRSFTLVHSSHSFPFFPLHNTFLQGSFDAFMVWPGALAFFFFLV